MAAFSFWRLSALRRYVRDFALRGKVRPSGPQICSQRSLSLNHPQRLERIE